MHSYTDVVWGQLLMTVVDKRHFCKEGDWSSLWEQAAVTADSTQTSRAAGKVEGRCVHALTGILCPQSQACSKGNVNLSMANKEKPLPNTVCIQYSKYAGICTRACGDRGQRLASSSAFAVS